MSNFTHVRVMGGLELGPSEVGVPTQLADASC